LETWRLLDLGFLEPLRAQTFYEAVASSVDRGDSPNTIILCQPKSPYVCIGFHQELEREIDADYCRANDLPIIRRSQGGGATYLDQNQVFYQVIARGESTVIPARIEELFEKLLAVPVYVYRQLGLQAEFKPLNDVVVNGRKISGSGAGRFGDDTIILVGNIILDLDYDSMTRVLRVPDEKFRDKMAKSMREWVTSLRRELGSTPEARLIKELLRQGYQRLLGIDVRPDAPTPEEESMWEMEVKKRHLSPEWLHQEDVVEGRRGRTVKVAEGVKIVQADYKATKLIRITAELAGEKMVNVTFSGDFFIIPENSLHHLESMLEGASLDRAEIQRIVEDFYISDVQTPAVRAGDFVEALMKLKEAA